MTARRARESPRSPRSSAFRAKGRQIPHVESPRGNEASRPARLLEATPAAGPGRRHPLGAALAPLAQPLRARSSAGSRASSSLVFLDLCGLTLGLYAALVLRELYHGADSILWGVLWRAETDWLPFLGLVTVLVFWRAGLYAERGHRAGVGRIVGVAGARRGAGARLRDRHRPRVPHLRARADRVRPHGRPDRAPARELRGAERRGDADRRRAPARDPRRRGRRASRTSTRRSAPTAAASRTTSSASSPTGPGDGELPVLGGSASLPAVLAAAQAVDELILTDSDFGERQLLDIVEQAHRRGVQVRVAPKTTALLTERAEYIPGQGTPLFELRPPAFAGSRLGREAGVRPRRERARGRRRPADLARGRRGDQARVARAGPLPRPPDRAERAAVRDAQVPHDVRGRRRRSRASSRRRTRPRARCSRSATTRASRRSAASCAASRSTRSRRC